MQHNKIETFSLGVETTVDRSSKNNRIMKWIKQGAERAHTNSPPEDDIEEESGIVVDGVVDDIEDLEIGRISPEWIVNLTYLIWM